MIPNIEYNTTDLFGLKSQPSFKDKTLNVLDSIPELFDKEIQGITGNGQFSDRNGRLLRKLMKSEKHRYILEIGVARSDKYKNSSTQILIDEKDSTKDVYFGVDFYIHGKMSYEGFQHNTHIIGANSDENYDLIMRRINETTNYLDLILIDGDHSINGFAADWKYVRHLVVGGYVIMHDTNFHPCRYFYDSIDENMFEKKKYFTHRNDDFGMVVCKRIK